MSATIVNKIDKQGVYELSKIQKYGVEDTLVQKKDILMIVQIIFTQIINEAFQMININKLSLLYSLQNHQISAYYPKNLANMNKNKKKIGKYFYYLNDCIGNGYSSQVFKGYQNNNKNITYAIKVIKLSKMTKDNRHLLQNQIHILKTLVHPNIIKLHEAFYSQNNCYIITDYCEGGTLEDEVNSNKNFNWQEVFYQLLQACKYLQQKLIIHRDIKPSNIFKKGRLWKLGDFGFARFIPYKHAQIQQIFMIGSPLYMPPQTLQNNIYSLKTDSFAFGILFYYLITKQYPWYGTSNKQIIQNYTYISYPIHKLEHLNYCYQIFFKGLCQINIFSRFIISDFSLFNPQAYIHSCQDLFISIIQILNPIQQIKLCKFIHSIDINIQHFNQMHEISQNLRKLLKFLLLNINQNEYTSNPQFIFQFTCQNYHQFTPIYYLYYFEQLLKISINDLDGSSIHRCQILRIKLIQLLQILDSMIIKNYQQLKISINNIVLHLDFSQVLIFPNQSKSIQYNLQSIR